MPAHEYYIGLMSGTSLDSIDAVLINFNSSTPQLIAQLSSALPSSVRQRILALNSSGHDEIEHMAELDPLLGKLFAQACLELMEQQGIDSDQVKGIGSHGQTIRHRPQKGYTLQIGDPNIIAELTGITTVADFRRRDMAAGGQGAPLVPAFHSQCFHSKMHDRVIINIGGMANITLLPKTADHPVVGYDTGPGNVLLDSWIAEHHSSRFDTQGAWAASGSVNQPLLRRYLSDPFFSASYPKSTGRELFNQAWITQNLTPGIPLEDVQSTLAELTAITIANAIQSHALTQPEIYVCGGGSHNVDLINRIEKALTLTVSTTSIIGLDPDWVEASAFAWLAFRTLNHMSGNLPAVTGASGERILGGIYVA